MKYWQPGTTDWQPPEQELPPRLISWTKALREHVKDTVYNMNLPPKRSNLSFEKRKALKNLRYLVNTRQIVIRPADKNLGLTVMDYNWYCAEAYKQFSDITTYQHLPSAHHIPILRIAQSILSIINNYSSCFTKQQLKFIVTQQLLPAIARPELTNIPYFYHIPKLHKDDNATSAAIAKGARIPPKAGRPIVSGIGWVTERISIWIDDKLQTAVKRLPAFVQGTSDFILAIEELTNLPTNCKLVTGDVTSLYTNIPNEDGIDAMTYMADIEVYQLPCLPLLARKVLYNNYFTFENEAFHQKQGTAMGTPMAPCYANLFMGYLEYKVRIKARNLNIPWPIMYKRYIDDIFLIWTYDDASLQRLLELFNKEYPTIKITWNINAQRAEFLDTVVHKGHKFNSSHILDINVHQKATNKYLYIPKSSFHPPACFKSLIHGELLRYHRIASNEQEYLRVRNLFYLRLRARGYTKHFLAPLFNQIKWSATTRQEQLVKSSSRNRGKNASLKQKRTPLVIKAKYTPRERMLHPRALLTPTLWNQLLEATHPNWTPPSSPITAFSRAQNVLDILGKRKT